MRRPIQQRAAPVALACGILQDGERVFFLKQKDGQGIERIGLPFVMLFAGQDPVKKMTEFFLAQTGIDGHVQDVRFQANHNAGSRKNKRIIPVLGFRVEAKVRQAKPAAGYSGYAWMTLDAAKNQRLDRMSEWLRTIQT
ncbi:hypothetical protein HYV43_03500 [Candidatus Micrarchaeota archaeon]|nr:hypothetical protein [Candidatus Micrarchaeota archaeon]